MRHLLVFCICLVGCGGDVFVGNLDSGSDAGSDAAQTEGGCPCSNGLTCCGDTCVNETNDPHNCGACGHACNTPDFMCSNSSCVTSQCSPSCSGDQTCCVIEGPGPVGPPTCVPGSTCPVGCPLCN